MAVRTTFTLDEALADRAREPGVNVSAAARRGGAEAVREALIQGGRAASRRHPESADDDWHGAEAWGNP